MIPRPYQRAAVAAARAKTAEHGNTLVALPVGAGKTAVAGFYINEEAAAQPDARFLVLQHTDELIEQNRTTNGRVAGLPASVVTATDDSAAGFGVGSQWLDAVGDKIWFCTDASAGAAVWKGVTIA